MREIHRLWPLAVLIVALLGVQLYLIWPPSGRQLVMFGVVTIACAAALCARWHVVATAVLCVTILAGTVLISGPGRAIFLPTTGVNGPEGFETGPGPLSFPETAAVLVLIVLVARTARPAVTAGVLAALALVTAHAALLRAVVEWTQEESLAMLALLGVTATAVGLLLRSRDRERALAELAAVERAQRDERFELARELHDVVAHHVTGMLVQAQAASIVSEEDKNSACALLPRIVASGTDAIGAMRHLVGTLRETNPTAPVGALAADLGSLVQEAKEAGMPVRADIEVSGEVGPDLRHAVLRLVQEALTNARKHARDATRVEVDVQLTPTAVRLSVSDDGSQQPAHSGGYGLVGMRERIELLGGRLFAGATGTGWLVAAELPLAASK